MDPIAHLHRLFYLKVESAGVKNSKKKNHFCSIVNSEVDGGEMEAARWGKLSADAKDMCSWTIMQNPKDRPSAQQLLDHPWLNVSHLCTYESFYT